MLKNDKQTKKKVKFKIIKRTLTDLNNWKIEELGKILEKDLNMNCLNKISRVNDMIK